jgi:hypothetical protein
MGNLSKFNPGYLNVARFGVGGRKKVFRDLTDRSSSGGEFYGFV